MLNITETKIVEYNAICNNFFTQQFKYSSLYIKSMKYEKYIIKVTIYLNSQNYVISMVTKLVRLLLCKTCQVSLSNKQLF